MSAVVQIVDKVGSGGQVLLDLNRWASGALLGARDEIDLADVQFAEAARDQPFAWSSAANAGTPGALAARQITVPIVLMGSTPDATAALVARVNTLVRSRFLLKLQRHGSTVPVWLRCAPTAPKWRTNIAAAGQPTRIATGTITTATDPYAVGARVDVGPVTVTQDPSTGTPFVLDVNGVTGDSLTPLVLRCGDSDLTGVPDRTLISVRRRGTPSSLAGLVVQGETVSTTLGTSQPAISTVTGDATMSGSSCLRATYAVDASGPWTATVTFSGLTGPEALGTYRLLVRCRRAGGAAGSLFQFVATAGQARLVEAFHAGGNDTRVIDLGLVQVPIGQPPYLAAPESPASAAAPTLSITVARAAAGAGTLDIDWIGLVPADEDTGVLEVSAAVTGVVVVDGWDHTPRLFSADPYTGSSPAARSGAALSWIGGVPRVAPGDNRLYVVGGLGAAGTSRAPSLELTMSASFWPRYGWLG